MSEHLPDWLARWLGVPIASPGEGTLWRLDHAWRLAPWLTVLLTALAVAYVAFLYRRERAAAGTAVRVLLASLRLVALGVVVWMIAAWTLALERSGLPHVVVMVDDSASMATEDRYEEPALEEAAKKLAGSETGAPRTRWHLAERFLAQRNAAALARLAAQQKLRVYTVGDAAQVLTGNPQSLVQQLAGHAATGENTRLGDGLMTVLDDLRGTPPSAIVLLTDGVNTTGESLADAALSARRKGVPLYTVAIGSSRPVKDIEVGDLLVDDVVFVNDLVQLEFSVTASGYEGRDVTAQLVDAASDEVLAETSLKLGANGVTERTRLTYRPTEVGQFEWQVRITPLDDEADAENNAESRTIEVRKDKLRVLMVWWQPSLEFRRLKALLEREVSIELKTVLQDADLEYAANDRTALRVFPADRGELFEYDVILFGDANPAFLGGAALDSLAAFVTEKGGGLAVIAGPHFTPQAYVGTPLERLLPVEIDAVAAQSGAPSPEGYAPKLTDLGAASAPLQLGDAIADTPAIWRKLSPWFWSAPAGRPRAGARVLVEHPTQATSDGHPRPLIATQFVGAGKVLYHASDETYRWRFRVGDLYFGRYWIQTLRYLSRSRADENSLAELTADRREYRRGEAPRLRVRFADDGRAPIEDDGVSVVVERQGQRVLTAVLSRGSVERGIFQGTLPALAEGKYHTWISAPSVAGRPPSVDFRVLPPAGEAERVAADVAELRRAAEITGGRSYTLANASRLWSDLPPGRQVPVESLPPIPLWNQWPPLAIVLTLLVTEWAIRKRKGMP